MVRRCLRPLARPSRWIEVTAMANLMHVPLWWRAVVALGYGVALFVAVGLLSGAVLGNCTESDNCSPLQSGTVLTLLLILGAGLLVVAVLAWKGWLPGTRLNRQQAAGASQRSSCCSRSCRYWRQPVRRLPRCCRSAVSSRSLCCRSVFDRLSPMIWRRGPRRRCQVVWAHSRSTHRHLCSPSSSRSGTSNTS
jgi:hypothetical protein